MKKLAKYRFVLILVILLLAVITIQAPYSFRHYENPPIFYYFLITFTNCLLYLIPTTKFIIAEKIFYAFLVSCFSLLIGTITGEIILAPIYGYDSNFNTLQSPEILENILFYFFTTMSGIGLFWI